MLTVVAGIIEREGEILICQRRADGAHPLKWEFPGGKVEEGEGLPAALVRELREELCIEASIGSEFARYENSILLVFYTVTEFIGTIQNVVFARIEWCERSRLQEYDFLENDLALVQLLGQFHVDQIE